MTSTPSFFDDGGLIELGGDTITGGDGNDTMIGDIKSVTDGRRIELDPEKYLDRLSGGDDTLDGEDGNDTMIGGFGDDIFVKRQDDDDDIIKDFVAGGTDDQIDISAFAYSDLGDVLAVATDLGVGVLLDFGPNSSVLLENVASADLTGQDFIF